MEQNKLYKKYIKYKIKFLELKLEDEKNFNDLEKIDLYKKKIKNMKGGFFFSLFGSNVGNKKTIFNNENLKLLGDSKEFWNNTIEKIIKNFGLKKHINFSNLKNIKDLFKLEKVEDDITMLYNNLGLTASNYDKKQYYKLYTYKKLKEKISLLRELENNNFCKNLYYNNLYLILPDSVLLTEKEIKMHRLKILIIAILKYDNFEDIKNDLNCKQRDFLNNKLNIIRCKLNDKDKNKDKNNEEYE